MEYLCLAVLRVIIMVAAVVRVIQIPMTRVFLLFPGRRVMPLLVGILIQLIIVQILDTLLAQIVITTATTQGLMNRIRVVRAGVRGLRMTRVMRVVRGRRMGVGDFMFLGILVITMIQQIHVTPPWDGPAPTDHPVH